MQVKVTDRNNKVHRLQIVPSSHGFTNSQYIGDAILSEIERKRIPVGDPDDEYDPVPIPVLVKGKKTSVCSTCGHLGMKYNMATDELHPHSPYRAPSPPNRKTRTTRKSTKSKKATKRAKRNA